jgi:hypothetical protein
VSPVGGAPGPFKVVGELQELRNDAKHCQSSPDLGYGESANGGLERGAIKVVLVETKDGHGTLVIVAT